MIAAKFRRRPLAHETRMKIPLPLALLCALFTTTLAH
ncbi:hypothetical protein SAMN05216247_114140 [Pseudomonas salomonii]|uniref:Uncharacterized protein n=1 Tax=Pseudomonas salomonii TaxID=191391 RepID=A0A1H3ULD7_9PSED|nr:hypothetical protein [Pseudomonas sp. 58 R 3]SDZ62529.1 hypothetical protein SAMN05216247_114140 [Pseudomonas salomonii]